MPPCGSPRSLTTGTTAREMGDDDSRHLSSKVQVQSMLCTFPCIYHQIQTGHYRPSFKYGPDRYDVPIILYHDEEKQHFDGVQKSGYIFGQPYCLSCERCYKSPRGKIKIFFVIFTRILLKKMIKIDKNQPQCGDVEEQGALGGKQLTRVV